MEEKSNFLMEKMLKERGALTQAELEKVHYAAYVRVHSPLITIGFTSSSIVSGSLETYKTVEEYLADRSIDADLEKSGSLGLFNFEPLMGIQLPGKPMIVFKEVTSSKVISILDGVFNNYVDEESLLGQFTHDLYEPWEGVPKIEELPFFKGQKRNLYKNGGRINPESISQFIASGGYANLIKCIYEYTPDEVCEIIEQSGLRGRRGEGFPAGKKWKIALNTNSNKKYLICNAGESDPGAFLERTLMESDPHLVIESLAIASYAISASKTYIYIESSYDLAIERLEKAINDAKNYGVLGNDIFQSGFSLNIEIKKGAGAYVCGEETALIASIEGKRGMPRIKPPYPATSGLNGEPTVVNNIETLLNVPFIIKNGPHTFKETGIGDAFGTKLFSLSGAVKHIGIIEVPIGTSMRDIIHNIGGGIKDGMSFKAALIGGPTGGMMEEEHLDLPIDFKIAESAGVGIGSGSIVVMHENHCIIDTVKYYMSFLKKESCGKCIPCREGLLRVYEILDNISKKAQDDRKHTTLQRFKGVLYLETLAEVMLETSMCGLGKGAARQVKSSLKWFRDEYEEHIFERQCEAGVCTELRIFHIDVDQCTGCTLCAKKCPTGAIIGNPKSPHFIVEDRCIGCGICYDTCKFSAVIIQ